VSRRPLEPCVKPGVRRFDYAARVVGAKKGQSRNSAAAGRQRLALVVFGVLLGGLFLGFAVSQGISAPSVASGDVAKVEGVPDEIATISEDEFKLALLQQVAQGGLKKPPKPGEKKYEELKEAALSELLDAIWLQGEAEELGIAVTPKEIEIELEQIKDQNFKTDAEYEKFLKTSRFTEEDVLDRVKLQIVSTQIQQRMTGAAPPATDSEIEDYYADELEAQFTEPESREARVVVNEDQAKIEDAKAQLEKDSTPASWKKVAEKVSEDPNTKSKGGLQAGLTRELLQSQPELASAVFDNDAGTIVGPTAVAGKYFLTEVVKLNPSSTQSLKEVRAQIKSQLDQQLQQEFFSEFVAGYQSRWEARTVCAEDYLIERCSNYVGDGHPSTAPEACYEADPKGGTPKDCPAPVQQVAPAFPGSVSETNPQGDRLPQRPRPEGLKELGEEEVGLPGGAAPPPLPE
jgi:foldase protein PrsA